MRRLLTLHRRKVRRRFGLVLVVVLWASAAATAVHFHADSTTHQSCATCTVSHHPQQATDTVALPEPVRIRPLASSLTSNRTLTNHQPFHFSLSRAPPA